MRINIATGPWLPVPAIQGGAMNRVWHGLAEVFAAKGHEVTIFCRAHSQQPKQEIINGVNYIRQGGFPQSTNIKLDLIKDLYYALTTFPSLPSGDILVINDFWLPVFASLKKQVGKVVINSNRFPKGQYWLYKKTDYIAAASQIIKETIIQQSPSTIDRIKVIPNPISTDIFFPINLSAVKSPEKTILYVGRIHPEKGVHLLIEAFALLTKKLQQVKLKIIGPFRQEKGGGGETYLNFLKSQAIGLPVEFLPPIFDTNKLANAYREADLFCYPSLAEKGESFGVAPLEAMASGLVPIVSDLACFKDFIEEEKTGYFFNHRSKNAANNLANTLKLAIFNSKQTQIIKKNAIIKASQFHYEHIAELYLKDFETLL
ncbi:MAG: glycosyltransferase family 4 protein [Xenococcaceae cyanobacterium MO_188.B19]|nr:glycosyltransferase family 4 protein [Xenococcaceae cyanobacterium MO_188.B19]